jgi:hypothetical protein
MVTIRFPDLESKRRALGFLADRFAFSSWPSEDIAVPDDAVPALTSAAIPFQVMNGEPEPTYEEVMAAYERGETLDLVDAFAEIAGMDREAWLRHVDEHRARNRKNGDS